MHSRAVEVPQTSSNYRPLDFQEITRLAKHRGFVYPVRVKAHLNSHYSQEPPASPASPMLTIYVQSFAPSTLYPNN